MNAAHLELCASAEWSEALERWILPWVLESADLGDDVLEIGPGPGLTTDLLRQRVARLTAVEVDPELARALSARLAGSNVEVVCADATDLPLPAGRFSAAVCLTMLHHVPSPAEQDALFAAARRVLRPGGVFVGQDSLASEDLRHLHEDDVYVPVDPATLGRRLADAGFVAVTVDTNEYAVRFRAVAPTADC